MPIGGPIVENLPPACPAGHLWGPPNGGPTKVVTGWQPCHCSTGAARGGHRTHHCETEGCPDPWIYRPACAQDDDRASIVTAPRPSEVAEAELRSRP